MYGPEDNVDIDFNDPNVRKSVWTAAAVMIGASAVVIAGFFIKNKITADSQNNNTEQITNIDTLRNHSIDTVNIKQR
ncbi:MAG: hypothetical protein ACLRFP_01580 [Alphaproteobacteria bacterium]